MSMVIRNEDIRELVVETPAGHRHLRAVFFLNDGSEVTLQEATVANLVRAYTAIKTHPETLRVALKGKKLSSRKEGFAEWQLTEG